MSLTQNGISCLIFDFDGVIANTDQGRFRIMKKLLNEYDRELADTFTMKQLFGFSTKSFLKKYSPSLGDREIEEIFARKQEMFFANLGEYCIPYPGMKETIEFFSTEYDLALATTNDREDVRTMLGFLGVLNCFRWIMGREITGNVIQEKDYSKVTLVIGKKTTECVVIEDSDVGVSAAVRAGFYCIRFDPDGNFDEGPENARVNGYDKLKEIHGNNMLPFHKR